MKKDILRIAFLISGLCCAVSNVYAQTGINTTIPEATLHIKDNAAATKSLKVENNSGTEMLTVLPDGRVGLGNANPAGALDINSTTGSLVPPRMTTVQRDALSMPPAGAIIFNTTANGLEMNYGTSSVPVWKTPVTSTAVTSNIVLAGGTAASVPFSNYSGVTVGAGYHQFTITLAQPAYIKLDVYPTVWANNGNGLGTVLYIDGTQVGGFSTATISPNNTHICVPYSYVAPALLSAGIHTIKIKADANTYIDQNDRISYSYLCWN